LCDRSNSPSRGSPSRSRDKVPTAPRAAGPPAFHSIAAPLHGHQQRRPARVGVPAALPVGTLRGKQPPRPRRAVDTLLSAHCYLAALASELVGDADLETAIVAAIERCAEREADLARERDAFKREP
jgi:hypothetical protein